MEKKNKFRMKFLQKGEEGAERPALYIYGDIYETYRNWVDDECGNAAELRKMADDLDVLMEANKTIYLEKAGDKLDYDKLTELLDAETWLTAEQCVEYGLADVVLERTIDRDAAIEAAGIGETSQRADDAIKALQRSRDLINDLVEFVEVEELELEEEEEEKPHNFLDMFS